MSNYHYNVQGSLEFKGRYGAKAYDLEFNLDRAAKIIDKNIAISIDLTTGGKVVAVTMYKDRSKLLEALDYVGIDPKSIDETSFGTVRFVSAEIPMDSESYSKFIAVATAKFGNMKSDRRL